MNGIALIGEPGSGKTSIANALCDRLNWERRSFAEPLRIEVAYALATLGPKTFDQHMAEMKDPATKDYYRLILQWWGTEHRRAQDPDYWVRATRVSLRADGNYVVDDCRFSNERDMLIDLGFTFIFLEPGETTRSVPAHASEVDWKHWRPDYNLPFELGPDHQAERIIEMLGIEVTT